jgi:hypothetical protein
MATPLGLVVDDDANSVFSLHKSFVSEAFGYSRQGQGEKR